MLTALVMGLLLGAPVKSDSPPAKEPPAKRELFAGEEWYRNQKGKEEDFVGVLEKVPGGGPGVVGFGRFNPYRLVMDRDGKKSVREVYVGGKPEVLAPYVGKKIKLTGKAVDMEVEGREHHEIWPARVALLAAGGKAEGGKELKILARAPWPARGGAARQVVLRTPEELAAALGMPADRAREEAVQKQVTEQLSKALKVEAIDWSKQMLVVVTAGMKPTGGYSVEIKDLTVSDRTLTVHWKLNTPRPGSFVTQVITHPSQVVLVEQFRGEVKFDPVVKREARDR